MQKVGIDKSLIKDKINHSTCDKNIISKPAAEGIYIESSHYRDIIMITKVRSCE